LSIDLLPSRLLPAPTASRLSRHASWSGSTATAGRNWKRKAASCA